MPPQSPKIDDEPMAIAQASSAGRPAHRMTGPAK
jgi:hypothetical protein